MNTPTDPESVERMAQELNARASYPGDYDVRSWPEPMNKAAAMLRQLLQERDAQKQRADEWHEARVKLFGAVREANIKARTAAFEEAAGVLEKWLDAAKLEGRYQANMWLTDALDEVRTLAAQARGESDKA